MFVGTINEASEEIKADIGLADIISMIHEGKDWKDTFPTEVRKDDQGLDVGMNARLALKGVKQLYELLKDKGVI